MGLINENSKTLKSFDLVTTCARARAGRPCPYCYVETARRLNSRPKTVIDYTPYDGWVMTLRPDTVARLNALGGVRMFGFADYEPGFRADCRRFLGDCYLRGLGAKAVTKVPMFVPHHHDHPALRVIHLSVDRIEGGSQVTWERAVRLREQYRKVLIRCVCLTPEDLEFFGRQDWVDIITLNHGANGFHQFGAAERKRARERYGARLCCAGGVCANCTVRCGADWIEQDRGLEAG